jgi:hypothetical protein
LVDDLISALVEFGLPFMGAWPDIESVSNLMDASVQGGEPARVVVMYASAKQAALSNVVAVPTGINGADSFLAG